MDSLCMHTRLKPGVLWQQAQSMHLDQALILKTPLKQDRVNLGCAGAAIQLPQSIWHDRILFHFPEVAK